MTIEELSSQIYKNTYNQLERSSGVGAAVTGRVSKLPFPLETLQVFFRNFVRDTPLTNIDLYIAEDAEVEEGVLVLDSIETFSDGESASGNISFDEDLARINL